MMMMMMMMRFTSLTGAGGLNPKPYTLNPDEISVVDGSRRPEP
jgi:hypothetical protein